MPSSLVTVGHTGHATTQMGSLGSRLPLPPHHPGMQCHLPFPLPHSQPDCLLWLNVSSSHTWDVCTCLLLGSFLLQDRWVAIGIDLPACLVSFSASFLLTFLSFPVALCLPPWRTGPFPVGLRAQACLPGCGAPQSPPANVPLPPPSSTTGLDSMQAGGAVEGNVSREAKVIFQESSRGAALASPACHAFQIFPRPNMSLFLLLPVCNAGMMSPEGPTRHAAGRGRRGGRRRSGHCQPQPPPQNNKPQPLPPPRLTQNQRGCPAKRCSPSGRCCWLRAGRARSQMTPEG